MENYIDFRCRDDLLLRVHFFKKRIEVRYCKKFFTDFYRATSETGKPVQVVKI